MSGAMSKKKFNYAVGHYWENNSGSIGCYTYHSEVHFGLMKDAKNFLNYVKTQSPQHEWKIFQLVEVPT